MWPYETYPELTKLLTSAAKEAANKVLESYEKKRQDDTLLKYEKSKLEEFIEETEDKESYKNRYIGNKLILNIPFGFDIKAPLKKESWKTDALNLYLSLYGCIAGSDDMFSIDIILNSLKRKKTLFDKWNSLVSKDNKAALPLIYYLYNDIYKLAGEMKLNIDLGYRKILRGEYGKISVALQDEIYLLRLGHLRQLDKFSKMKEINESSLDSGNLLARMIYNLQQSIGLYYKGDFSNAVAILLYGRDVMKNIENTKLDIFNFEYEYLLSLAISGETSKKSGFIERDTFFKKFPHQWEGWSNLITDAYSDGVIELKKKFEKDDITISISKTLGMFYNYVERLRFWAHRSGLDHLETQVRKIRQSIFFNIAIAFEEKREARQALQESVLIDDNDAIKAIKNKIYPWEKREDFDDDVNWALKCYKDGRAFKGALRFFNNFVGFLNDNQRKKALGLSKKGIKRGYSFCGEYDWGRPAIELLKSLIISKYDIVAEKCFKIIDDEYKKLFNKNIYEKTQQLSIYPIRMDIAEAWGHSIYRIPEESEIIDIVIDFFKKIKREILEQIILSGPTFKDSWKFLIIKEKAFELLEGELSLWREGKKSLLEEEWFYIDKIFNKLSYSEKSVKFEALLKILYDEKEIENKKDSITITFPTRDPFLYSYEILLLIDEVQRKKWIKAVNSWFLSKNRNPLEIYKGWHSLLEFATYRNTLKTLRESSPELLKDAIERWTQSEISFKKYEGLRPYQYLPSPSLVRFMAATFGRLLSICEIEVPIPYDEILERRKGLSIDGGISLALCFGLLSYNIEEYSEVKQYIDLLYSLTFQPSFRIVVQSIYALLWSTEGPAKVKANDYLKRLLSDKDKRNRSPIRIQKALDYVEEKLKEKINTRKK